MGENLPNTPVVPTPDLKTGVHFPVVGFGAQRFVHYYKRVYGEWVAEFQDAMTGKYHYLTYNEEPTFLKGGQRYRLEVNVVTLDDKPVGE